MQPILKQHLRNKIEYMASQVLRRVDINMSSDDTYEALINDRIMLEAFNNASKFLPRASFGKYHKLYYGPREVPVHLNFVPSNTWRAFLLPEQRLVVDPMSHLGQQMNLLMNLQWEWSCLYYVFDYMAVHFDVPTVAFYMSWLYPLCRGLEEMDNKRFSAADRRAVELEKEILRKRPSPRGKLPIMSDAIRNFCRQGANMVGQYNLLMHSKEQPAYIAPGLSEIPSNHWIIVHLNEMRQQYEADQKNWTPLYVPNSRP
jgi:hypothetical protein